MGFCLFVCVLGRSMISHAPLIVNRRDFPSVMLVATESLEVAITREFKSKPFNQAHIPLSWEQRHFNIGLPNNVNY